MPSNHLILCCLLLLLPSIFPSIRIFSKESVLCNRWPKCWNFSFIISSSSEYSGWISLRIDWWDIFTSLKGSQESSPTPQFKRFNSSVLDFLYSPILIFKHDDRKNNSIDYTDLCWQITSLLFYMLSRLAIAFLERSKHLLISWLVTICCDFGAPTKNLSLFPLFPHLFASKWWDQMPRS